MTQLAAFARQVREVQKAAAPVLFQLHYLCICSFGQFKLDFWGEGLESLKCFGARLQVMQTNDQVLIGSEFTRGPLSFSLYALVFTLSLTSKSVGEWQDSSPQRNYEAICILSYKKPHAFSILPSLQLCCPQSYKQQLLQLFAKKTVDSELSWGKD